MKKQIEWLLEIIEKISPIMNNEDKKKVLVIIKGDGKTKDIKKSPRVKKLKSIYSELSAEEQEEFKDLCGFNSVKDY